MTETTVLTGAQVQKRYRARRGEDALALSASDFAVREGDFISLVGPSGCGKTTLLKICAGLIQPTGGSVTYRDTRRSVQPGTFGMVFQSPALLPWRTVARNLLLPQEILRRHGNGGLRRVDELLELVHLPGVRDRYPKELSGGMQQRVAIARALMHDPDLLFMDEPFGALDAITREELNIGLQEVQMTTHKTVLFVTHDIPEAVFLADRVFVMSTQPGRIVEEIRIDLPRPRTTDSRLTAEFRHAEARIRHLLHPDEDRGERP